MPRRTTAINAISRVNLFCLSQQKEKKINLKHTGSLLDFLKHIDICSFQSIACPNKGEGCGNIIRKNLSLHMAICPNCPVECSTSGCVQMVRRAEMTAHRERCPYRQVQCAACHLPFPWISLSEHKKSHCKERVVQCIYRKYGCKDEMKARNLVSHVVGNELRHLSLKCDYSLRESSANMVLHRALAHSIYSLGKRVEKLEQL